MKNLNNKTKKYSFTICLLLFAILLLLPQAKALAATYYVDIDGVGEDGILGTVDDVISSDSNPGTAQQPWKTLGRALIRYSGAGTKVAEGDTVYFKNGSYGEFRESTRENDDPVNRNNWITYKAAPGHSPVLGRVNIWNTGGQGSYLVFDGFTITERIYSGNASYLTFRNCKITSPALSYEGYYAPYVHENSAAIDTEGVTHVTIEDCDIYNSSDGISASGQYWVVQRNKIHDFASDGIHFFGAPLHYTIDRNHIYNCIQQRSEVSIWGTRSGTFEVGETVIQADTNAQGIYSYYSGYSDDIRVFQTTSGGFALGNHTITGQTSNATISNITLVDMQHADGISLQSNGLDVIISNNIIHDSPNKKIWNGIKLACDAGGSIKDVTVANNLVYDTDDYAIYMGREPLSGPNDATYSNVNFYNNTFWGTSRFLHLRNSAKIDNFYNNIIYILEIDNNAFGVVNHGNNIFRSNPNNAKFTMNATETVTTTPGFVDAANGNFNLASSSVAINFGNASMAPSTDILGNLRDALPDAGAYEYISSTPPPPPPVVLYGDVSGDGQVTAYDAALTAQAAVGLITTLTPDQIKTADVSGNGEVSAYDAALIAQKAVGLSSKEPFINNLASILSAIQNILGKLKSLF